MKSKFKMYDVTFRRDVQQKVIVRVDAENPHDAIAVAEAVADEDHWQIEEHIGSHKATAKAVR